MGATNKKGIFIQSLMMSSARKILLPCCAFLILCSADLIGTEASPSFTKDIAPLFSDHCVACHTGKTAMGGLRLDNFENLLRGGQNGKALIPGDSRNSRLFKMVTGVLKPSMPLGGNQLEEYQIGLLKRWIDAGAAGPKSGEVVNLQRTPSIQENIEPTFPVKPQIFSLAYHPDGENLALGGFKLVRLVSVKTGNTQAIFEGMPGVVRSVSFSQDGRLLAAAGGPPAKSGEVKIFNVVSQKPILHIEGHTDTIYDAVFSPSGKILATSSYDRLIKLWDVKSGEELRTLKDHIDAVYSLAFTPDGQHLISGAADRSLKIWSVSDGERLYTISDPLEGINAIAIDSSGKRVAAGGLDRTIRIWELGETTGTLLRSLIAHEGPILQIAFSPDGSKLVTASTDGRIKVFRSEDLTELTILSQQSDWVMSLKFSPDGSHFAAGRFDGSFSIYDSSSYSGQLYELHALR